MLQLRCPLLATLLVTSLVVRFRFTKKCLRTFLRKRSGRLLGGDVLPLDWNGRVRVEPSIVKHDGYLLAHVYGREPTHWRVFVQCQNGKYEWLETCTTKAAADTLAGSLGSDRCLLKSKKNMNG